MDAKYIDHMGSDLTVVNAARVSFDKESQWESGYADFGKGTQAFELQKDDKKLINYLASHNHWTPFSHCTVTLREKVPIFVARQRFKHMVGFAYNEVSRRYVSDEPEFFTPDQWRGAPTDGAKQGSSNEEFGYQEECGHALDDLHTEALETYLYLLELGVAPEQARMVLPQSMYTEYYVTGSLAAWARAYQLRIDSHAQKEIQDLAKQWGEVIDPLFPVSWRALTQ